LSFVVWGRSYRGGLWDEGNPNPHAQAQLSMNSANVAAFFYYTHTQPNAVQPACAKFKNEYK